MNKIIRLTESDLHSIIRNTVYRILKEDGEGMGGGATAGATSDSADRMGAFDVPFGGVQSRSIYKPKTNVNMSPALKRHDGKGGSISIPKNKK